MPRNQTGSGVTRRELVQGAAAAALALEAAPGLGLGDAGGLVAGAAKRIITPDPLLPVSGGLGPSNPVTEKRGELTARALYLQRGNTRIGIISLDLLGFPSVLGNRVRAAVPRIPAGNIVIGSTHSHSAPECYAFPDGQGGHTGDLAFMDRVTALAAEALNEAINSARPARLRTAVDEAKGQISYNYYAPSLYDPRMGVIQAEAVDGKPIATLVNYATHPEVLGSEVGLLSPDLCGPLYDRLESLVGGTAIFMNSAQGGMVTADNRYLDKCRDPKRAVWDDGRTWEECIRIGELMANEANRIINPAPWQASPSLYCRSSMVKIAVDSPDLWAVVTLSPLKYPHGADHTIQAQVNLMNIGDAQVITIPGEALPNIGFYLKRKMRGAHNLLFGLTNDAFGYIMTEIDFDSFETYRYISRVSLGEKTCPVLMARWLDLIRTSPAPDRSPGPS